MTAMLKNLLLVVVGLAAGLAVAYWSEPTAPPMPGVLPAPSQPAASREVASGASAERLAALERALAEEIAERAALEERVAELAATVTAREAPERAATSARAEASAEDEPRRPFDDPRFQRAGRERRDAERLVAAGFSPDRAEWLERRVEELRMQALQAQYEATRDGRAFDPAVPLAATRTLRGEIGDDEYERYLQALGRSTAVVVREVLASSPAERAGLQPGDQVVAYGGERVFDQRELNALTLEGQAGESVVLDVRRNGQTIQLVVPRGPIGITGGGFRGR